MEKQQLERQVTRRSALIYVPLSFGVAAIFYLAASLVGDYPPVAKIGGMVWLGLLSLIVSMPLVTARVKTQLR